VPCQNVVGARRASWRVLNQAEALVKDKMESEVLQRYLKKVEKELQDLCGDVLNLLRDILIPQCPEENYEEMVFYLKMAGDYYRCVHALWNFGVRAGVRCVRACARCVRACVACVRVEAVCMRGPVTARG
jgi:hypothetical protein